MKIFDFSENEEEKEKEKKETMELRKELKSLKSNFKETVNRVI